METTVKELRRKTISLVKILRRNHSIEETIYELETKMKKKYPHLFEVYL